MISAILLVAFSTAEQAVSSPKIILSGDTFSPDERITIAVENPTQQYSLEIQGESKTYKYSGDLNETLDFYARETGQYKITLFETASGKIVDEKTFEVREGYFNQRKDILYTDKKTYSVNEPVEIYVPTLAGSNDTELKIFSETESLKYLDEIQSPLTFVPKETGNYTIQLRQGFEPLAETKFEVGNQDLASEATNNRTPDATTIQGEESNGTNETLDASGVQVTEKGQSGNDASGVAADANIDGTNEGPPAAERKAPFRIDVKNNRGEQREARVDLLEENTAGPDGHAYDVEMYPEKAQIRKIRFDNLKMAPNATKTIGLDEITLKGKEFRNELRQKKIVKSFFLDTSPLDYTNGTMTILAGGRELWKCKEWNATLGECQGTWKKVMDLTPGTDYSIEISPEDPAYAETGVASINTRRPLYHPNETADIIIVVLDTAGHLVSDAYVNLTIVSPDGMTTTSSTADRGIAQTDTGIYETQYTKTSSDGKYDMFVSAQGRNTNSSMQSYFEVRPYYEFDILRDTPATIDPWQGAFESRIRIVSLTNASSFDFTEILPSNFEVTASVNASTRNAGNKTFLTWANLTNNSIVSYSAKAPLMTPDLFELGPAIINYGSNTFYEARPWYLAIDPASQTLLPDANGFYSAWTIAGSAPAASLWQSVDDPVATPDDAVTYAQGPGSTTRVSFLFPSLATTKATIQWVDVNIRARRSANSATMQMFYRQASTDYTNANTVPLTNTWTTATPAGWNYTTNPRTGTTWTLNDVNNMEWGAFRSAGTQQVWITQIYVIVGYSMFPNVSILSQPADDAIIATTNNVTFNFTAWDDTTPIANCSLWSNFSGSWTRNATILNVANNTMRNINVTNLADGTYVWNIVCTDNYNGSDSYPYNYTFTVEYNKPPRKAIVNVDSDTSAPWATTNRNPYINISLNKNGNCRISQQNRTFAEMAGDVNCTGTGTMTSNCTYTGAALPTGTNDFYVACNDTRGNADNRMTNLYFQAEILCDSHADCASSEYCDYTQHCAQDVIPGYNCMGLAYGGLGSNEVCGNGANSLCVNDSSYSYTGWYCTATATDCVYNDNGNSYTQNYKLCIDPTNNYRYCNTSNQWSAIIRCASQGTPANRSATYHAGEYCEYYAADQACNNGISGGCNGSTSRCTPHIFNQTSSACGATVQDCDMGCGATCDPSNSTAAVIASGICYYDKSCSNTCAWSQNQELAPTFCINDNDGGTCAYTTRTNPTSADTCYWQAACNNIVGASLTQGSAGNLRTDYCDFCDATGNHTGQYSPTPTAPCTNNCDNTGTMYYDSTGTSGDRTNDCNSGTSTILSDVLSIGDIWNGTAQAHCDSAECQLDCGRMQGSCNATQACECLDSDNPTLLLLNPQNNTWTNTNPVAFFYNASDNSSDIQNCSLLINGLVNKTNTTIDQQLATQEFTQSFSNGTRNWSIVCYDSGPTHNMNQSETRVIGVDTETPTISTPNINGTNFTIGQSICLNVTASDGISGLQRVYAAISVPSGGIDEVDLSDSSTTACDATNGNGVYSAEYLLTAAGAYNWTVGYAVDQANNENSVAANLKWNATTDAKLTINMTAPSTDTTINESDGNNYYLQSCNATCDPGNTNCQNVSIYASYFKDNQWNEITNVTTDLTSNATRRYCGDLWRTEANWWNNSWGYRKQITVQNRNTSSTLESGYTVKITLDTTGAKFLATGNDLRIVYWNGSTNIELDRINDTAFNSAATQISFKVQANISANSNDKNYYAYYGNPSASTPPTNKSKIYDFWDDFSGGLGQWTVDPENLDAVSINASVGNPGPSLMHRPDSTQTKNAYYDTRIITNAYRIKDGIVEYDIYLGGTARSISQFGPRTDSLSLNSGYAWRLQYSAADGGWFVYNAGAWTSFGTQYPSAATGVWHHVILNFTGPNFNANVDGGTTYSGTNNAKLTADYLASHVHGTGTDYYVLIDNIKARKYLVPEPSTATSQERNSSIGSSCSASFNITSGPDSGNNTWPIRCEAMSNTSGLSYSGTRNLTINDHPIATFNYPADMSWLTRTISINASSSHDSDGSITNYLFEYDNNSQFTSPASICNGPQANCTLNTTRQNQCQNNTLSCYLRLTVRDDKGLSDNTTITVGFDTQSPAVTLANPASYYNVTNAIETVSGTATDGESGIINVTFEYRKNSTDSWHEICTLTTGPYECDWSTTNLNDSANYEVRERAVDAVGNPNSDVHTNITIDRTPPSINLESPQNNNYTSNATVMLHYNVTDVTSEITSCSLLINNMTSQTNSSITKGHTLNFTDTYFEKTYNWSITCTDAFGNTNTSETRNFTIDKTGPATMLQRPGNGANITGRSTYFMNATATDSGTTVDQVTFEYRQNDTEPWTQICSDTAGPEYNCTWDLSSLPDADTYEVRAWASDILGNNGTADTHQQITIDNNPPEITITSPENNTIRGSSDLQLIFTANDIGAQIANCSLYWNGNINQTNNTITETAETTFNLQNLTNGNHSWEIRCTDTFGQVSSSGGMNITIDIKYILQINITTPQQTYQIGNEYGAPVPITTQALDLYGGPLTSVNITNDVLQITNKNDTVAPWWNTSWKRRVPIYISTNNNQNRTNITIVANITGLNGNISSCVNEIRVASSDATESPVNVISGDNSNYCYIAFKADLTANAANESRYFIYYNNSAATNPVYATFQKYQYNITTVAAADSWTNGGTPAQNNGLSTTLEVRGRSTSRRTYIRFNFTSVPTETTGVNNALLCLYLATDGSNTGLSAYHVYDQTWAETVITHTNQPCGTAFNNAANCNLTAENTTTTSGVGWKCLNVTKMANVEVARMNRNLSIALKNLTETGTAVASDVYDSREYATTTLRPYLNITGEGTSAPNITQTRIGSPQTWIARTIGTVNGQGTWNYAFNTTSSQTGNYTTVSSGTKTNYTKGYNNTFFELTADQTPPVVALNSPPDGNESNSAVTFTYKVNDTLSTVSNCSLLIDGNIADTDPVIEEGPVQFFYPRIPLGGWHNWSVNCTDYYTNTGASETWQIYIKPPDLSINATDIVFNTTNPKQGNNITINATIFNLGGSDAVNLVARLYLGDPDNGGTPISGSFTLNITDINGDTPNATIGTTWIVPGPGPFIIYAVADPPAATNGSIFELREDNNKANKTLNVPGYHYFYGNIENNIYLADSGNKSLYYYLNITNATGNILAASQVSNISFLALQALGRTKTNTTATSDFTELDTALNMTLFNDSISRTYASGGNTPNENRTLLLFNKNITNVPIVNSTNNSNFKTGILWDTSDGGTEYNGSQDVVFAAPINLDKPGAYGTYDYELKVPVKLQSYNGGTAIEFYWEILNN